MPHLAIGRRGGSWLEGGRILGRPPVAETGGLGDVIADDASRSPTSLTPATGRIGIAMEVVKLSSGVCMGTKRYPRLRTTAAKG